MKITFYGVRGSIATPGPDTVKYGGNTACVLLEVDDGRLLIFDGGTGIRSLGDRLVNHQGELFILFSHYHWDHIQGIPFFRPAYQKDRKIHLITNHLGEDDAFSVLDQMVDPHFPVPRDQLHADVDILSMDDSGKLIIGEANISSCELNHPGGGAGYRVDTAHGSMAYITDNELYPPGEPRTSYREWVEFISGVDLLIHDAMYLDQELPDIHGWGHSLVSQAMQLASDANISHLVLFHHDPSRTDQQLDEILENCRQQLIDESSDRQVFMAREGDCYSIILSGVKLL